MNARGLAGLLGLLTVFNGNSSVAQIRFVRPTPRHLAVSPVPHCHADVLATRLYTTTTIYPVSSHLQFGWHPISTHAELMLPFEAYFTTSTEAIVVQPRPRPATRAEFLTARNQRRTDMILNHTRALGARVHTGNTLNELLGLLDENVLAHDYSTRVVFVDHDQQLTDDMLCRLKIRRATGRSVVFSARDGQPLCVDRWPFALRSPRFTSHREQVVRVRARLCDEARRGPVSYETLIEMEETISAMRRQLRSHECRYSYRQDSTTGVKWGNADQFLRQLGSEVVRLQHCGTVLPYDGCPPPDTTDLIEYLRWMVNNGLEFSPAVEGDEGAYHQLAAMMRDLLTNVADSELTTGAY